MKKVEPSVIVDAYHRLDGNKTAVADELGIHRDTVRKVLKAEGIDKPLHSGRVEYMEPNVCELPSGETVKRYIITSAQNNTKVHGRFWENLQAYANWLDAEIMVSRFTYNKNAYSGTKSQKPGREPTVEDLSELWYDSKILPYICDDPEKHGSCQWQLAPGLMFCAEMNILPTASRPLSGLGTYTGMNSAIFPHAKLCLEAVPTGAKDDHKHIYTTGTVTHRNYIQKKAGLKADFHHAYAALLVEVNSDGKWWVRQLNATTNGNFQDCPREAELTVRVADGQILEGLRAEALQPGDVHASEIDDEVADQLWDPDHPDCMIDALQPKYQFLHDVFSMRSRSHHEMKKFGRMFMKWLQGEDSVEEEITQTASLMEMAWRKNCEMVVVNSNHDRHGEIWLDNEDYRKDIMNSEFFLSAQLSRLKAYREAAEKGEHPYWDFHTWALKRANCPQATFLRQDESRVICKDRSGGIECGWHGDDGPNGSRGTTQSLLNVGRRVNKGHDHTATIRDGVYSAGACRLGFAYMHGPSSHSLSHIVTYPNGKRQIITMVDGKWRA